MYNVQITKQILTKANFKKFLKDFLTGISREAFKNLYLEWIEFLENDNSITAHTYDSYRHYKFTKLNNNAIEVLSYEPLPYQSLCESKDILEEFYLQFKSGIISKDDFLTLLHIDRWNGHTQNILERCNRNLFKEVSKDLEKDGWTPW